MLSRLLKRIKAWREERRRRRLWTPEDQLDYLRVKVTQDARWLAHDPVASALCERYLVMLAPDWYQRSAEDVSDLRQRLGLDPHEAARAQRVARQEDAFREARRQG